MQARFPRVIGPTSRRRTSGAPRRPSFYEMPCSTGPGAKHLVRDQEAGGPNPLASTNPFNHIQPISPPLVARCRWFR